MSANQIMEKARKSYWTADGGETEYARQLKQALKDMYFLATGEEYTGDL